MNNSKLYVYTFIPIAIVRMFVHASVITAPSNFRLNPE